MEIAVVLLSPSPRHPARQIGSCHFIQHNVHLLTPQAVNTTCKVALIFNVTINCFENKSSHVEKQQKGQEANPGTCSAAAEWLPGEAQTVILISSRCFCALTFGFTGLRGDAASAQSWLPLNTCQRLVTATPGSAA